MESKTGLMSRDSSEGLDAKELALLSDIREEAIATQAATEPKPEPETKHHLSNVPFTQWPMGASPSDRQVGQDDAGNPLFEMQFSKNTYSIKRDPDQRTQRQKLKDAVATGKQAVTNYLQGDDYIPSASEVAEFGKAIAVTAYETLEGAMEGRGTIGDVFGMAPTMAVAGAGFKVPKGALRTFGGKGMDLDDDQTSRFADARSKFKKALNTVDVNDPAAFYDLNKKIWKETGWFINPKDRQWRYQINDKPAIVNFNTLASDKNITTNELINNFSSSSTTIKLPELFQHPKLFERYPHLKNLDVRFHQTTTGELGSHSPGQNRISFNTNVLDISNIPELKSTLLHEVQHAIQEYEGFSYGTNPDFIPDEVLKERLVKIQTAKDLAKSEVINFKTKLAQFKIPGLMNEVNSFFQPLDTSDNWNNFYIGDLETGRGLNIIKKQFNLLNKYPEANNLLVDLQEFYKDYLKLIKDQPNVEFQFYRGTGGEIESRLVEALDKTNITEFPLDAEKRMIANEGLDPDFISKVDQTEDFKSIVRSPKLGEADVYIERPTEFLADIMDRINKKKNNPLKTLSRETINEGETIYVKNIFKGYPELKKLANIKEGTRVTIDGKEYEFKKFAVPRIEKKFIPEEGQIIFKPPIGLGSSRLDRVTIPTAHFINVDKSLPADQRLKIIPIAKLLQNKDLVDEPFDIQKLSEPPKSKKSIVGQMKSLFGYDEGGLTTSLRPFTREDSIKKSNKRKNELKQLGDLEFRADLDKQLSWNPLARLGYQPDKTKVLKTDSPAFYAAYDTMVFDPDSTDESLQDSAIRMGFPEEEAKRLKAGDVYVTSDTAFNPVFAHEYTHVGLEKVFKLAKKDPKAFKEKYGEDAYGLIVTSTDDYIRDEYLTELFDDLTTKFNSLGLGDTLKVSDKFPNKSIAFTTDSDRYDDKFIDTRELFQDAIKDKDTKTTKEDVTTFNENLKGIFGIMDAAQDILTEQGEPPKAKRKELSFYEQFKKALGFNEGGLVDTGKKTVSGRTIWNDGEQDYSERTTTFQIGNRFYTMPTVAEDGSQYSDDVMKNYVEKYGPIDFITGEELPTFATEKEAVMYAIERSDTRKGTEQ